MDHGRSFGRGEACGGTSVRAISKRGACRAARPTTGLALLLLFALAGPPSIAHAQVTDAQVQEGIERLIQALYDSRNEQGHWDRPMPEEDSYHTHGAQWGGTSALAVYALIAAGESYQQPEMAQSLDVLRRMDLQGVYARGLRAHVYAALPPEFESHLREDVNWLLNAANEVGSGGIAFDYVPYRSGWSNSRTQYGLLGVWEGAKRDVPIPDELWQGLLEHFLATQNADGSWPYSSGERLNTTTAMTAAGLTGLYVVQDYLHRDDFRRPGVTPEHPLQRRIELGLDFLNANFRPDSDRPGRDRQHLGYHLYGVERVGLASGYRYFNDMDWFASGAEHILGSLNDAGHARLSSGNLGAIDSSFALLFLVRGNVPVFINKLELSGRHWNNRPRDLANLTAWASDEAEREMMWQIVPADSDPHEWLAAPMLYIASHQALSLTEEQEASLRRYVDLGGMLVFAADDDQAVFNDSVEELLERLFPRYPLESIDPEDDLLGMVYRMSSDADGLGPRSVHNGVRHLAIHLAHGDVSWTLHRNDQSHAAPWRFLTNAYFYATERGRARSRLDAPFEHRRRDGGGPEITIGRAVYAGNHDPEPLAWEVQANFLYNREKADVTAAEVQLDSLPAPSETPFVHVAGTVAHAFTEQELESIRDYVEEGGRILFETVGGRGDFARSANDAMRELFDQQLRPASTQSPLIHGEGIDGFDLREVTYRPYTVLRMGRISTPRLITMTFDGEPRIMTSGEDLSKAMLDQPVWGVFGYDSDSARKLMANMVLTAVAAFSE